MHLQDLRTRSFQLPKLRHALSPFEMKCNPFHKAAETHACAKFDSYNLYTDEKLEKYLSHDIAQLGAWVYPETPTQVHLEECIALMFWLLAYDDMADESGHKKSVEGIQCGGDLSLQVLADPHGPVPKFKFARMLQDIVRTLNTTGKAGCCTRFTKAFETYLQATVRQTTHRADAHTPSVEDFIKLRRGAGGVRLTYAMELDIPDEIHDDAKIQSIVDAAVDIICWTNDICSFNKEQSHGDSQNLVYCAFVERNCSLQEAVDFVADMVFTRVDQFLLSREEVARSFDLPDVAKFLEGLEYGISGYLHWSYNTERYFSTPVSDEQVIRLYQRKEDPDPLSVEHVEHFSESTAVEHVEH
ncbi:isoprenoid synthase domain-containing protein [Mycena rosella]|uniref:Terpene synthase n=1 Tax=Mycena rosella TaxID=1033263 RepID=A0AAD7DE84_MYCRO|nr:isoprenoid synthase domain-containing protein [Mycena rosella]